VYLIDRRCIGTETNLECPPAIVPVHSPDWIGKHHVEALNEIRKRVPDAQIVVSSTWRILLFKNEIEQILSRAGVENWTLLDTTTTKYPPKSISDLWDEHISRGWQIDQWLKSHPEVESFVILDDDNDMWVHSDKLVKTDFNIGLQIDHVEQILDILKEKKDA